MAVQLKYGSQGDDVKILQRTLNENGDNLVVDGVFGKDTQKSVMKFQEDKGLAIDGIVGDETQNALYGNNATGGTSNYTPTAAPTINPTPTAPTYDTSTWDESEKGSAAGEAYEAAKNALSTYGDFVFSENEWLNSVKDSIQNYGDFSYDVNSDALYQQYAEQYARNGKIAMQDTMGQAAALTGGYGNSYASSVGNQAYQSYMQQLNDKVPELYQLALDRYNMGKEDLYNQYGMLLSEYEREYGLHSDEYNKLLDSLGIARDDYYSGADMFYTEQGNTNDVLSKGFNDSMAIWEADTNNKWKQAEWDESLNQYANDEMWRQKEYDLSDRQVTLQEKAYEDSQAASTDNTKSYSGKKSDGSNYNNGSLTNAQVKELQAALGVSADGYYGPRSQDAAGGLSAAEAYAKYVGGGSSPTVSTSGVSEQVRNKAASFESNSALGNYIDGLVSSGVITEAQGDALYAEYVDDNEKYDKNSGAISYKDMVGSTQGWTVTDDGGWNLWGVDKDAKVKAPNGETMTLNQLREKLKAEGMTHSEASDYIKKLQQNLGISSNWMFGW